MIYTGDYNNIKMITWVINNHCNFNCTYCCTTTPKKAAQPIDLKTLSEGLDFLEKDWLFHITGGEPFLEKNMVKICKEITKNHFLSISTNLSSTSIFDFADKIDPSKCLFINASVHIKEREKKDPGLSAYIGKILYLQMQGFHVIANYVAHPSLFHRMKSDAQYLASKGVQKVRMAVFKGMYNGKYYPHSLHPDEKELLNSMEMDHPEREILHKTHHYYNHICKAGQRFFVMDREGNLKRCSSLMKNYGNLFAKSVTIDKPAKPCPAHKCRCPYEGIRNTVPRKGNAAFTFKENLFENYLKFNKLVHDPQLMSKVKEKTVEYLSQSMG